jgi:thioredoxin 1
MSRIIGKTQFKTEVMESDHLSLVQFKTEWSGACQIIAPVYEELSKFYNGIAEFFSIDVEQEAGMEKEFGVQEFPTILFFKNGKLVDHVIGLTPKNALIAKIENALA